MKDTTLQNSLTKIKSKLKIPFEEDSVIKKDNKNININHNETIANQDSIKINKIDSKSIDQENNSKLQFSNALNEIETEYNNKFKKNSDKKLSKESKDSKIYYTNIKDKNNLNSKSSEIKNNEEDDDTIFNLNKTQESAIKF